MSNEIDPGGCCACGGTLELGVFGGRLICRACFTAAVERLEQVYETKRRARLEGQQRLEGEDDE